MIDLHIIKQNIGQKIHLQVTTFSKLLVDADREDMQADLKMPVMLSHLGSFETEREFCNHFM